MLRNLLNRLLSSVTGKKKYGQHGQYGNHYSSSDNKKGNYYPSQHSKYGHGHYKKKYGSSS